MRETFTERQAGSQAPHHSGHTGLTHRRRLDDDGPDRGPHGIAKGQQEVRHAGGEGVTYREDCRASCGIRGNAATDSDGKRPPNPIESDHLIRTKAATLLIG